jgi:hypothetical protein
MTIMSINNNKNRCLSIIWLCRVYCLLAFIVIIKADKNKPCINVIKRRLRLTGSVRQHSGRAVLPKNVEDSASAKRRQGLWHYPAKSRICVYSRLAAPKLDNTDMARSQAQALEVQNKLACREAGASKRVFPCRNLGTSR